MQLKSYGDFPRTIDLDPFFDNTKLVYGDAGTKVPYTPQNTWTDPNGSAKDYLEKTKGLTTLQKVGAAAIADLSIETPTLTVYVSLLARSMASTWLTLTATATA